MNNPLRKGFRPLPVHTEPAVFIRRSKAQEIATKMNIYKTMGCRDASVHVRKERGEIKGYVIAFFEFDNTHSRILMEEEFEDMAFDPPALH